MPGREQLARVVEPRQSNGDFGILNMRKESDGPHYYDLFTVSNKGDDPIGHEGDDLKFLLRDGRGNDNQYWC